MEQAKSATQTFAIQGELNRSRGVFHFGMAFRVVMAGWCLCGKAIGVRKLPDRMDTCDHSTMHIVTRLPVLALAFSLFPSLGCGGDEGPSLTGDQNIGGIVEDDDGPISGATVSIRGTDPLITTTTNASGVFVLEAVDADPFLLVEAPGHWGSLTRLRWNGELRDDLEFDLPTDAIITEPADSLRRTVLATNGIVAIEFISGDSLGGESATLDVNSDPPITFDANDEPVERNTIISGREDWELIYTNVPVGDVGFVPMGNGTVTGCSPEFDTATEGRFPVLAKVITRPRVSCGPI